MSTAQTMACNGVLLTLLVVKGVLTWPEHAHVFASQGGLDILEKSAHLSSEAFLEDQVDIARRSLSQEEKTAINLVRFYYKYSKLRNDTRSFLSELLQEYKLRRGRTKDFDSRMNYVLNILDLDDPAFEDYNLDYIIKEGYRFTKELQTFLYYIPHHVNYNERNWLAGKSIPLVVDSTLVDFSLFTLDKNRPL
ncbi:hypothetical protein PoB_000865600 [Plakobranchus ocellatus]|uniref:Uncharacterized protein n=1 Tax=Plakobranchus ocellatus TaxID=259542 RepID=A0AAV3YIE8_9GAST|nr:hypothetical protein PoB_000865600 [Plakobranchus ocellatus]